MSDTTMSTEKTTKPRFRDVTKDAKQAPDADLIDDVYKDSRVELIRIVKESNPTYYANSEFFYADVTKVEAHKRNGAEPALINGKEQFDRDDLLMHTEKGRRERRLARVATLAQKQVDSALAVKNAGPNVAKEED